MGVELACWARELPDALILGIELYQPGIGSLFSKLVNEGIENVRVIEAPAQSVIGELPNSSVDEIRILFPDPWPKKRHHKRRLVQKEFICQAKRVLVEGGRLQIATDWKPYADWILSCIEENTGFAKEGNYILRTHFLLKQKKLFTSYSYMHLFEIFMENLTL